MISRELRRIKNFMGVALIIGLCHVVFLTSFTLVTMTASHVVAI